jgi:hypothetical protein
MVDYIILHSSFVAITGSIALRICLSSEDGPCAEDGPLRREQPLRRGRSLCQKRPSRRGQPCNQPGLSKLAIGST